MQDNLLKNTENDLTLSFMDEFNIIESSEKDKRLGKFLAVIGGICSLIPQNAVIVTFDYFQAKFIDFNVYFYMVIPLAFGLTVMSLLIYPLSTKLKIYERFLLGNVCCLCLVPLMPIIAYFLPNATGFWACILLMFFLGLAMQLITAGGISFTSAFVKENYTTQFFTGGALAGVFCAILRIILLSFFGSGEESINKATMIFFIICGVFYLSSIKLTLMFSKTEYSLNHISKIEQKVITNIDKINQLEMTQLNKLEFMDQENNSTAGSRLTDLNQLSDIGEEDQKFPIKVKTQQTSSTSGFALFKIVLSQIWPLPILIIIGQIQTAVMYPGYSISKMTLQGISLSWKTTSLAFTYTFGDVIGRMSTAFLPQSEILASKIVKLRFLICFAFIVLVQEWFPMTLRYLVYLNLFLLAFTNGWSLTLSIVVGGKKATSEQKETGSAILGLAINIGIISGMVMALIFI